MLGLGARPDRRVSAHPWVAQVALVVSATTTGLVVLMDHRLPNGWHNVIVAVACIAYVVMLVAEQRWGGLNIALVAAATIASTVVALSVPPRFTGDLWAYAASGRILAVHHVNPWTHSPAEFPHDPIFRLVAGAWAHTPSVSGPLFTGISALGATVVGTAALPIRLFYQGLAALALGGAGMLVWYRTHSAASVAFLTVHPVAFMYLVNGGRNDIFVGLAMLGAVMLLARDRPGMAGVVGGLGALVKITGTVGLVALLATTLARGSQRATRRLAYGIVAVVGIGFLAGGRSAVTAPMKTAGALYSRASAWRAGQIFGSHWRPNAHVALVALAVLVIIVIVRYARASAAQAVAGSLIMLSLGAAYTLPGYVAWGLPAAALDHRSRVARIGSAGGIVLVMAYELARHPATGVVGRRLTSLADLGAPLAMALLVVALASSGVSPTRSRSAPGGPSAPASRLPSRS